MAGHSVRSKPVFDSLHRQCKYDERLRVIDTLHDLVTAAYLIMSHLHYILGLVAASQCGRPVSVMNLLLRTVRVTSRLRILYRRTQIESRPAGRFPHATFY